MADGKRPGGLTALAVINFIWGGFSVIFVFGLLAAVGLAEVALAAAKESGGDISGLPSTGMLYVALLLLILSAALLITSGVGYLGQKAFLGRKLGNSYAILSIAGSVVGIVAGQGFGLGTIVGLIYPALTLFLLNTTFKDDLVN